MVVVVQVVQLVPESVKLYRFTFVFLAVKMGRIVQILY